MITFSEENTGIDNSIASINNAKRFFKDLLNDYEYEITVRPMFGCWRIFAGIIPFSALIDNKLYFRAGDHNRDILLIGDVDVYVNHEKGFHGLSRFYRKQGGFTTEDIKRHAVLSIKSFEEERSRIEQETNKRIKNLPNMSIKTERLLKKCGITTQDELIKVGSVNAYHEILKMNKLEENFDILYSIDAALKGIHKEVLPLATKTELTRQLSKFGSYNYGN